jgi:lysophospholipase-3
MIHLITTCGYALQPVFLVPPFSGSNLWVSYNSTSGLPWFCPRRMDDTLLWVNPWQLLPKRHECFLKLMTTFPGPNGTLTNWPNVTVSVHDFGGEASVRHAIHLSPFNISFYPVLASIIDYFKRFNYTVKHDLFLCPYDWRISPVYNIDFFNSLKSLVEQSYEQNKTPAGLFGFSLGGCLVHHFLTSFVDAQWKARYVSRLILLAPSHVGTVRNFYNYWTQAVLPLPWLGGEALDVMVESLPIGHSHMLNQVVYRDSEFIIGPEGETYKPAQVLDLIKSQGRIRPQFVPVYEQSEALTRKAPIDPGLPVVLIYNSDRPTAVRLNFSAGWKKKPVLVDGRGDGVVPAEGIEWTCKNWSEISCVNLRESGTDGQHHNLISSSRVMEMILNLTRGSVPDGLPSEKEL